MPQTIGDEKPEEAPQAVAVSASRPASPSNFASPSNPSDEEASLLKIDSDDQSNDSSNGTGTQGMFDTGKADEYNFSLHRVNLEASSNDSMPLIGEGTGFEDTRGLAPDWDQ